MGNFRFPLVTLDGSTMGSRPKGRPSKCWIDCCRESCRSTASMSDARRLAQDSHKWRTFSSSHHNSSGVTGGGGGVSPRDFWQSGKFLLTYGYREKRGKEKKGKGVKIEKKRRKVVKGRWKIENGRQKSYKMRQGPFFLFFFLLFTFQNH